MQARSLAAAQTTTAAAAAAAVAAVAPQGQAPQGPALSFVNECQDLLNSVTAKYGRDGGELSAQSHSASASAARPLACHDLNMPSDVDDTDQEAFVHTELGRTFSLRHAGHGVAGGRTEDAATLGDKERQQQRAASPRPAVSDSQRAHRGSPLKLTIDLSQGTSSGSTPVAPGAWLASPQAASSPRRPLPPALPPALMRHIQEQRDISRAGSQHLASPAYRHSSADSPVARSAPPPGTPDSAASPRPWGGRASVTPGYRVLIRRTNSGSMGGSAGSQRRQSLPGVGRSSVNN